MKKIMVFFIVFVWTTNLFAQVSISPTSLFIDSKRKFETLLFMNSSDVAQEVRLSWVFGYPDSDEKGNVTMFYGDSIPGQEYSAAEWMRGFPKNFILEPGARQTVRVTIKAPRDIAPGTYWTRLKTLSSPLSAAIGVPSQPNGISAQITLQFNQITSVFYKTGELSCGLTITEVKATVKDGVASILAGFNKTGNSPFLGQIRMKVYDSIGDVVKDEVFFQSIYWDGWRRVDMNVTDLPQGTYDYELIFSTDRSDIPDKNIVPAETVSKRGSFTKL